MSQDADTDRTVVKTFVPAYQKDEWKRHAEDLDMSQSEFVRTMVQAGRRGFEPDTPARVEPDPDTPNPGGNDLETRLLELLEPDRYLSWDELLKELAGDFEDRLEDCLGRLQDENRVEHNGRRGGYTVVEDGE